MPQIEASARLGGNINTIAKTRSAIQQIGNLLQDPEMLNQILFALLSTIEGVETVANTAPTQTYSAGVGVTVTADKQGVTAAYASNTTTITIPAGVTLYNFYLHFTDATKIIAGPDAGGVSNYVLVKIAGTGAYNTSTSNMKVPVVQKTIYNSGAPSVSNGYLVDVDSPPDVTVIDVSGNSITIRIGAVTAANGSQFTFSEI